MAEKGLPTHWRPQVTPGVAVLLGATAVRLGALALAGPRLGGDSPHYLSAARQLQAQGVSGLAGLDPTAAPLYPVVMAASAWVFGGDPVTGAVAMQVLLGAVTAALLARIAYRMSAGSLSAAVVTGGVAAVYPALVFWGLYVLTESLFLFLFALCLDRLLVLRVSRRPAVDALVAGLAVGATVLTRPTAGPFALFLPMYVWMAVGGHWRARLRALAGLAASALPVAALLIATQLRPTPIDLPAKLSNYVWSAIWFGLQWTERGRATPGIDIIGDPPGGAQAAAIAWIASDPVYFLAQAARKLKVFWSPVLPEFSVQHAAVNLAVYLPLYAAAIGGVRRIWRSPPLRALVLAAVASFTLVSMITFVDYDQRFRLPVEVCLIPLAGVGIAPMIDAARRRTRVLPVEGLPAPARMPSRQRERELRDREAEGYRERYGREKGAWWDDLEIELITGPVRCRPGTRVLDAGAGVGRVTTALAPLGCAVDAFDISPASLAVLLRTTDRTGGRIRAIGCDLAHGIPTSASVYDGAVSGHAIHHLPDRSSRLTAWRDIARACKPGAVLSATVYHLKRGQAVDGVWLGSPAFHRYTAADLTAELREAGWSVRRIRKCYRFEWKTIPPAIARAMEETLVLTHFLDTFATYLHVVAAKPTEGGR